LQLEQKKKGSVTERWMRSLRVSGFFVSFWYQKSSI